MRFVNAMRLAILNGRLRLRALLHPHARDARRFDFAHELNCDEYKPIQSKRNYVMTPYI